MLLFLSSYLTINQPILNFNFKFYIIIINFFNPLHFIIINFYFMNLETYFKLKFPTEQYLKY
jgi:hypothetical protein